MVQPYYALGDGAEEAVERCLRDYYGPGEYTDAIVARAATDAETVRENVRAFAEAGCDELIFFPCDPDPDQVDLLADALAVTEFATYPSLRGQVAFVSGGATGLGAEFVAQLAAQGVRVGFVDVQDDAGHALAERVGGLYQHCDVRDVAALQDAIAVTGERLGPVTVLVNNAANDQRQSVDTLSVRRSGTSSWRSTCAITSSPPRRSRR